MMKRVSFVVGVVCMFAVANFGVLGAEEKEEASKKKVAEAEKVDKERPKAPAPKKAGKVVEKVKRAPKQATPKPGKEKPKKTQESEKDKPEVATKQKPAAPIKEMLEAVRKRKAAEHAKDAPPGEKRKPDREGPEKKAEAEENEDRVYKAMLDELTDIVAKHERERIAESEKRIEAVKARLEKHLKLIQQGHAEKEAEYRKTVEGFRADLVDLNRRIEQLIEKYTPASEKQPKSERSAAVPSQMNERDIAAAKAELFKAGMEYFFRAADVYIPIKPFIETFFDEKGVSISVYDHKYKEEATAQVNLSYDESKNTVGLVSKGEDFVRAKWKEIPPRKK